MHKSSSVAYLSEADRTMNFESSVLYLLAGIGVGCMLYMFLDLITKRKGES